MPGLLKPTARCPECGDPLLALSDLTSSDGVDREYYHERLPSKPRCRRFCKAHFDSFAVAQIERRALEVSTR